MLFLDFLPYIVALFIMAIIPGPGIGASLGKALGGGFRPAFYFVNGLILGDIIYLSFAIFGLAAIANILGGFFIIVKYLGAAYLLWLAWEFWHRGVDFQEANSGRIVKFWPSLLAGCLVSLGNPKIIIFYLALLPNIIDMGAVNFQDYLILLLLTILVLYLALIPYISLASGARLFFNSKRAINFLSKSAATIMVGAATFILFRR